MPKVSEVCHVVRSKVAGPFWVTMDLIFDGKESFEAYSKCQALNSEEISRIYGVDADQVKHYTLPKLNILKATSNNTDFRLI
jgi:abortive infection bacteriophage resistance protein